VVSFGANSTNIPQYLCGPTLLMTTRMRLVSLVAREESENKRVDECLLNQEKSSRLLV
jgi:hypothetical protein